MHYQYTNSSYKCSDKDAFSVWTSLTGFNFTCEPKEYLYDFLPIVDIPTDRIGYYYQCCKAAEEDRYVYSDPVTFFYTDLYTVLLIIFFNSITLALSFLGTAIAAMSSSSSSSVSSLTVVNNYKTLMGYSTISYVSQRSLDSRISVADNIYPKSTPFPVLQKCNK